MKTIEEYNKKLEEIEKQKEEYREQIERQKYKLRELKLDLKMCFDLEKFYTNQKNKLEGVNNDTTNE